MRGLNFVQVHSASMLWTQQENNDHPQWSISFSYLMKLWGKCFFFMWWPWFCLRQKKKQQKLLSDAVWIIGACVGAGVTFASSTRGWGGGWGVITLSFEGFIQTPLSWRKNKDSLMHGKVSGKKSLLLTDINFTQVAAEAEQSEIIITCPVLRPPP